MKDKGVVQKSMSGRDERNKSAGKKVPSLKPPLPVSSLLPLHVHLQATVLPSISISGKAEEISRNQAVVERVIKTTFSI